MDDRHMENDHPPYWAGGPHSSRPLRRVVGGRVLAGVAGGLADYLEIDVAVVRIGFVAFTLLGGIALPAYLACWLLIPKEGSDDTLADDLLYSEPAQAPNAAEHALSMAIDDLEARAELFMADPASASALETLLSAADAADRALKSRNEVILRSK